ncbi:hypothetical protein [Nocardioides limicola]|uniref:hypothetical protein n=1 Tax=Nocardioides limicola TaxID=2803368 RepID=UPI00193B8183|nr:hypothetical protein [Nocardioides sp. DJM-14]
MSIEIVYVLTALAALVVVLTRVRLSGGQGAGHHRVGSLLPGVHTVFGVIALATWVSYLVAPDDSVFADPIVGVVAIGAWWVVTLAGLLILLRWLPSRGRHASESVSDSWSDGPGLSLLAHLGMLVGVGVFTWAYLTALV